MRSTIFSKLKQEYSHLGLGDTILQAHADSLNAIGLVNAENLNTVISAQKTFLENLQQENDRRATDAYNKAKLNIEKKTEATEEMPEWFKAEKKKTDNLINTLQSTINTLTEKNVAYEKEKQANDRKNLIASKAKALGIPEFRINEGFAISDTADENAIEEYLTTVANNVKTQLLPGNKTVFPLANGDVEKADADAIAKSLIGV